MAQFLGPGWNTASVLRRWPRNDLSAYKSSQSMTKGYVNPRLIVTENGFRPLGDPAAIISDEFNSIQASLTCCHQAMDNGSG